MINNVFVGQYLENIPGTRVMSEPVSFISVGALYNKGLVSYVEYKELLEATFLLQCKINKDVSNIDHIVIKWNPFGTSAMTVLKVYHTGIYFQPLDVIF